MCPTLGRMTHAKTQTVPDTSRARSNSDVVFDSLRADILAGVHAPGVKLKFADLADRYQASVSVLREALARLAEQRLVESEPRVGFRVVGLSGADLQDLTRTRIEIESLAIRHAIAEADLAWESELLASHHRLDRTPMLTDTDPRRISDEWEEAHAAFHRALVSGCGSVWLVAIADNLRDCSELYRRWSGAREPGRDVAAEHQLILDSALARDDDAAVAALVDHYDRTLRILLGGLTLQGT